MLVFKHPKFYEEIRKRAKREQALERKRASEQAGGWAHEQRAGKRASKHSSVRRGREQAALNVVPIIDGEGRCFAMIGQKTGDRFTLV
tara:strand:- start:403 stop:666 length:264 start_codon:yes stop_codon:yes gene_type:complete